VVARGVRLALERVNGATLLGAFFIAATIAGEPADDPAHAAAHDVPDALR
jgi:hypothetical protein